MAGLFGIGVTVAQAVIGRGVVETGEVEALTENIFTGKEKTLVGRGVEKGTGRTTTTRMGMVSRGGTTVQSTEMRRAGGETVMGSISLENTDEEVPGQTVQLQRFVRSGLVPRPLILSPVELTKQIQFRMRVLRIL